MDRFTTRLMAMTTPKPPMAPGNTSSAAITLHNRQSASRPQPRAWRVFAVIGMATFVACSLLILLATPSVLYAQAPTGPESWLLLPPMPTSLADAALGVMGEEIYIVGGFSDMGPSAAHFRFTPGQMQWTPLPALPVARANASAAILNNQLYVVGGYNQELGGALTANHRYDPVAQQWFTATATLAPASGAGSAVIAGELLLFGGFDNQMESTAVQRYHPTSDRWTLGTPMPLARSEFSAVTVDDLVYIFGGNVFSITHHAGITPTISALPSTLATVYDPQLDQWHDLAPLPQGRVAYATAVRAGQIYVIGGLDQWVDGTLQRTVLVYDIASDRWSAAAPLPMARSGLRATTLHDHIYVFGGYGDNGYIYATTATYGQLGSKIHLPLVTR